MRSASNVADDHVVTELGEARTGDETDVTGTEDSDPGHGETLLT